MGAPSEQYYSNLGYFVRYRQMPHGANAEEQHLYEALKRRLDAA
ncbi:MAG: hypothetical protein ACJ8AT_30585 [Hyalangium sp.]